MIEPGQVDVQALLDDKKISPMEAAFAIDESEKMRKHMSPPGSLLLPPFLEARRQEYGLPDCIFSIDAVFQHLFLFQLAGEEHKDKQYGDSGLFMTDRAAAREEKEEPRGIIVSAGVDALDYLVSHGMCMGHIVYFCEEAPYGIRVGIVEGKEKKLVMIDAGDVVASQDLAKARLAGDLQVVMDYDDDNKHKMVGRDGNAWTPIKAPKRSEGF